MIIVGLGNPGKEYFGTRHNLGFVVVDALAATLGLTWSNERGVMAARFGDHWLLKPQTYMNRSGDCLKDFFAYKNISINSADLHRDLIIVHDELDFPPGEFKLQRDRSSAGHNGVQSVIDAFSSKDFSRIRIGIGKLPQIPIEEYVLQNIPAVDQSAIDEATTAVVDLLRKKLLE